MTIRELEETYQQLREQLLRGELEESEFKAEVEKLQFADNQGNRWKVGWYTGNWYRYDQGRWVQGYPQDRPSPGPPLAAGPGAERDGAQRRALAPYLVTALIVILLLASVGLLIGWNSGWGTRPVDEATSVSNTSASMAVTTTFGEMASAEATSTPSPTKIVRVNPTASETPTSTASAQPPTPTTTPSAALHAPLGSPSPEVSVTNTPGQASTTPTQTSTPRSTSPPVPPTQTPPLPKPSSGQIFFPVYDTNPDRRTLDIHVLRLATGQREVMVGQASQPALSPDGKRLAYRSLDTAGRGLWVRELGDGNTWRWIDFHEAEHPSWSPDGQSIVFSSQQESDREWRLYRTWGTDFDRVNRQGGDIFGRVPAWADDGRIIYWECPLDKCGLYSIHPDGTNLARLTSHEHDTAPAVSPSGSQVAFMSNEDGNWEVYLADARTPASEDGQGPRRLTNHPAQDGVPAWSPDGQWLAFVSDRDGAWAIWVMRPSGSAQQKLLDLGGSFSGRVDSIPSTEQHGWTWETMAWGP